MLFTILEAVTVTAGWTVRIIEETASGQLPNPLAVSVTVLGAGDAGKNVACTLCSLSKVPFVLDQVTEE